MPQSSELINQVMQLLEMHRSVFGQERVYLRALWLVVGEILAFKSHRVTDWLRAMKLVDEDWTAWYRLYERPQRFMEAMAGQIMVRETLRHVSQDELYVIGVDCSQVPRDRKGRAG